MHILYLHQYFCPPGGSGNNRSFELAKEWVKLGHQVTLITSPAYFPAESKANLLKGKAEIQEIEGITVHILPVDYDHLMPFSKRILSWIRFYRQILSRTRSFSQIPDLIFASSTPLTVGEAGRKLARRWQRPFVFETVDVWPDVPIGMGIVKNPFLVRWLNRRTNKIYAESAAVVTLSEGMQAQVLSHGAEPGKVFVFHNGTHPEEFPFVERSVTPDRVEVLYTGTVGLANGLDQLVKVAEKLKEMGRNDIRITILGGGNDLERVKGLANQAKMPNLRFLQRVPKEEVPAILASASIGVVSFAPFPVLEANSANKFYDYLASGLPVLLNYEGWQAHYLRDWNAGLSSPQGDQNAFLENLLKLADSPELCSEMGRNGRRLALEKFDRRAIARGLSDLFERIILP